MMYSKIGPDYPESVNVSLNVVVAWGGESCGQKLRTHLPYGDPSVGILDGGHPSVRVDAEEGLLLHVREADDLVVEWDVKLFEDDVHFQWVGTHIVAPDNDWLECRHGGWLRR